MNEVLAFSLIALLLVVSPGPNGVLILKTASSKGRNPSILNILGLTTATFFHGALSIFGLSALLMQSAELFLIIKILFIIGAFVAIYAVLRNLDIIKIILIYFKDLLLGK